MTRERWMLAAILTLTAALYLPSITPGFVADNPYDDWLQLASLEGAPTTMATRFDLWKFYTGVPSEMEPLRRRGDLPTFFPLDFRWRFWRPVSSALSTLDFTLFGRNMIGFHADCTLWLLLLIFLVARLFERLFEPSLALLATFAFAMMPATAEACCWIPARHVVVAASLSVAGLLAHVRWRRDGWRLGRLLSLVAVVLAFGASEASSQTLAYFAAYEMWAAKGTRAERMRALAPVLLLGLAYLCTYVFTGCGVRHAEWMGYHDPFRQPLATLENAFRVLPDLFFNLLANLSLSTEVEPLRHLWVLGSLALGALHAAMTTVAARRLDPDEARSLRFLVGGSLLSLLPALPSQGGSRMLLAPGIGAALVAALVARQGWDVVRARWNRVASAACSAAWAVVVLTHFVLAPVFLTRSILALKHDADSTTSLLEGIAAQLEARASPSARAVFLFRSRIEPTTLRSMPRPGHANRRWWPLVGQRLVRTSAETFDVIVPDRTPTRADFWPRRSIGEVIVLDAFTVTVETVNATGMPLRYEVRLPGSLDDPSYPLFMYAEGDWRRLHLGAIGTFVDL